MQKALDHAVVHVCEERADNVLDLVESSGAEENWLIMRDVVGLHTHPADVQRSSPSCAADPAMPALPRLPLTTASSTPTPPEIIDWSLTGTRIGDRTRPLADKTMARIAGFTLSAPSSCRILIEAGCASV